MAIQDPNSERAHQPTEAPTGATIESSRSILDGWRERRAERTCRRLVSARSRRVHAQWLRRTVKRTDNRDWLRRRRKALLHYRAAAARTELLELAAMLEHTHGPDPECMTALHDLLANRRDSSLYNADIPVSELHATIRQVRAGL